MHAFNIRLPCDEITPKTAGLGAVLGQKKIKPIEFCNKLGAFLKERKISVTNKQAGFSKNMIIRIVKNNDNFEIVQVNPYILTELIKSKAGIQKGSDQPGKKHVHTISSADLRSIATYKRPYFFSEDEDKIYSSLASTAKSMGLTIE